jgi:diguanylate cyclase (GGDEF)-like protein/PAS domain S-box-containing protein
VQNASDIVLVIGEAGEVRYHTPSAERFVQSRAPRLDGSPLHELVHPEDRLLAQGLIRDALSSPGTTPSSEWRLRWSDGSWHYVEARAKSVPEDPNLGGVILTLRSVHEHKVLEERLAYQAFHDPLTHLANRMLLSERLEHALVRARRGGLPVSVLFIDLDDFKNVNDSFGHATGDQLLIELSRRLLSCVRASDTAARLGGDEFAVLVEERGGLESARQVAARVAEAVARPFVVAGREIVLGASVGIASSEGGVETAGDLLRNADVAMYCAKRAGKRQVVLFEASMQTAVRERLELEGELRGVLERGELTLVYQPIVALASGRIVGAEALLRWDHPVRGRLRPADFFPAAEAAGVMAAIGYWTVEDACRRACAWPVIDEAGQLPLLCVNVAPQLLGTREFVSHVERTVAAARLPAGRLVLELTEGAAVEDAPTTFAAMRRLRAMGVRVAIDDFGTGYSSLSYLRDMPVDILKLDKLFVDGLASDDHSQMLTRGILDLARALGKLVVAEGIEQESQAARLRALGCTLGQGFFFSQPLDAPEMLERLRADAADRP